jgi:hypothetical protein
MTELERRIEDGVHYEHLLGVEQSANGRRQQSSASSSSSAKTSGSKFVGDNTMNDTGVAARAVFCGYRFTEDDYNRLKSAHPSN